LPITIFDLIPIFIAAMKKLLAFFVLLSHINFTMLIPQVDERDTFEQNGRQTDDINSLFEYIDQVVLGNRDDTPEDEDDDTARVFQVVKMDNYSFSQDVLVVDQAEFAFREKARYPLMATQKIPVVYFDVQLPPPKI
jgi:hypothetical protein